MVTILRKTENFTVFAREGEKSRVGYSCDICDISGSACGGVFGPVLMCARPRPVGRAIARVSGSKTLREQPAAHH